MSSKNPNKLWGWYFKHILIINYSINIIEFACIGGLAGYLFLCPNPSMRVIASCIAAVMLMILFIKNDIKNSNIEAIREWTRNVKIVDYQDLILKEIRDVNDQTIAIVTKQAQLLVKMTSEASKKNEQTVHPEPPKVIN